MNPHSEKGLASKRLEIISTENGKVMDEVLLINSPSGTVRAIGGRLLINEGPYLAGIECMATIVELKAKREYEGIPFKIKITDYNKYKSYSQMRHGERTKISYHFENAS